MAVQRNLELALGLSVDPALLQYRLQHHLSRKRLLQFASRRLSGRRRGELQQRHLHEFDGKLSERSIVVLTVPSFTPGPAFPTTGPIPPQPGVTRNSLRGPRYFDIDMTLGKAFGLPNMKVIGEHGKITLRANFFNIFNKLNLNPTSISNNISFDGVTSNPHFGQAQGALGGRIIELQARFSF